MKKSLLILLISGIFITLPSCRKNYSLKDNKKAAGLAVDKIRENLSDSLGISFPSLSILIQTPTDKIFVSSVGDAGQVVTPDTYFRFASNSTYFTAMAILNMYEYGWLDYKAKITDLIPGSNKPYVPATSDWDFNNKNEIIIELLLQHAAGFFDVDNEPVPGYNGFTYTAAIHKIDPTHQFATGEMVKVLKEHDLSFFKPGKGYHYSNKGYSILAEIIKRFYSEKTGSSKTYGDYLEDSITGTHAAVLLHKIHSPVLAFDMSLPDPHIGSTILEATGIEQYDDDNMTAQIGEGNGWGTMAELHTYIRTMMKGQNVLKAATIQLMPKDVSVLVMIPLYDFRTNTSFGICFSSLSQIAFAVREILGYPGKP